MLLLFRFDKLVQDATVQRDTINTIISAEMSGIDELMDDLERKTKTAVGPGKCVTDALKAIRSIASNVDRRWLGRIKTFQFCDYQRGELSLEDIEKACGDLIMKDMKVILGELLEWCYYEQ